MKSSLKKFFFSLLSLSLGWIKGGAFFFLFFFLFSFSLAQQWQSLGPGFNYGVGALLPDSGNILYAGGGFTKTHNFFDTNGVWISAGIARWDGSQWDSLGSGFNRDSCKLPMAPNMNLPGITSIVKFQNQIFAGGNFYYAGGIPAIGIAMWNGVNWDSIGTGVKLGSANYPQNYGTIRGMYVYNNELYCMGQFDSIAGIPAKMIAKYDGVNWYPLPTLDSLGGGWSINAAIFYKGELYVGGNFVVTSGPNMADIARFDGVQWKSVGGGTTCDCVIDKFYIWHDTLIVAGYFQSLGGMPFNNIAAWDGNNWIELGDGLMPANVYDVIEYDNHLYACGQIDYLPDGTPINRMAKWDGQQWKDAGLDFRIAANNGSGTPLCMAVMNDELYIGGGFFTVNGDTMNNIMKYNASVGINEVGNKKSIVSVFPNPSDGKFTIENLSVFAGKVKLTVYNALGQKVFENFLLSSHKQISLPVLSNGLYFIKIISENNIFNSKILIQR